MPLSQPRSAPAGRGNFAAATPALDAPSLSQLALADPTYNVVRVGANDLRIHSGTPTTSQLSNSPVWVFPDAATSGLNCAPSLVPGVEYDVYLVWSNAAASAGVVRLGYDRDINVEGVVTAAGTSRFINLRAVATASFIVRTQLNDVIRLSSSREQAGFRIDRRGADSADTLAASINIHCIEFVPRLPLKDADIRDGGKLIVGKYNTPWGNAGVLRGLSHYTPLWTTDDAVYVAEPVTVGGTQQSRVAKLTKGYATVQDVQIAAATHDVSDGHRQPSVAVASDGNVVVHPEGHHLAWAGKHTTTPGDLTSLTTTTTPTGTGTNVSYRRFYRNPYNGDLWLACRGNTYSAGIYKWNTGTLVWDQIGGGFFADGVYGPYGLEIAFGGASTVYVTTEFLDMTTGAQSGYPSRSAAVVKSVDGGTTWTSLNGITVTLPLTASSEQRLAFTSARDLPRTRQIRLAVAADGNPVVVGSWQHPGESFRSVWTAKWDPTAREWVRRRLMSNIGVNHAGNVNLSYTQSGRIIAVVPTVDDHTVDGSAGSVPPLCDLYCFVSDDGTTWTRYLIGENRSFAGAYVDPEAYRVDGKVRILPMLKDTPEASQIWEFTLPA